MEYFTRAVPRSALLMYKITFSRCCCAPQGTNAHVLVAPAAPSAVNDLRSPAAPPSSAAPASFRMQHCWMLVQPGSLAPKATLSSQTQVVFEAALESARLAYLSHHRVQGRAVMPAAGLLEAAAAAASALAPADRSLALRDVAITTPLVMTQGRGTVLRCTVSLANGSVQVTSHAASVQSTPPATAARGKPVKRSGASSAPASVHLTATIATGPGVVASGSDPHAGQGARGLGDEAEVLPFCCSTLRPIKRG